MYTEQDILGKQILLITAHPDDESFIAGGTLYKNTQSGGAVDLYCATAGEQGLSCCASDITSDKLAIIRKDELLDACKILQVRNCWLGNFPDGNVSTSTVEVIKDVIRHCGMFEYDLVMGFGPDGYTGHNDHVAMNLVAQSVGSELNLPLAQFTMPEYAQKDALSYLKARRKSSAYAKDNGIAYLPVSVSVEIDCDIKMRALMCHESQYGHQDPFDCFPKSLSDQLKCVECYNLAKD